MLDRLLSLYSISVSIAHTLVQVIRLIFESFRFAWNALTTNLLRTILSLLGVTIGIFAIIAVFTIVDSLENSIKNSFAFLGTNVINVEKWPYGFDGNYPWWKYMNRPQVTYAEYEFLDANLKYDNGVSIYAERGGNTFKQGNNSSSGNHLLGVSYTYADVFEFELESGRYFSPQENANAHNAAIIGVNIAEDLFPNASALGQTIKIRGLNYQVIGISKREGESIIGTPSKDNAVFIPYKAFLKLYYSGQYGGLGSTIAIKGSDADPGLLNLEAELQELMRRYRRLKPLDEDSFALNRTEAIANQIGIMFQAIGIAGWFIGGFAILVGGFGIANIMFVSVKERTNIIGIQKSLGAKNYFVLLQFLFEAIFLSLIGGGLGVFLVFLITLIPMGSLEVFLSFKNIILGLSVAAIIGVISGIVPAFMASRMDPVIAIRTQ